MACKILFPFSWWLDESLWPEPTLVLLQIRTFIPRPGKKTHFLLSNCVLGLGVRKIVEVGELREHLLTLDCVIHPAPILFFFFCEYTGLQKQPYGEHVGYALL